MFDKWRLGLLCLAFILLSSMVGVRTAQTATNPFDPAPGSPITTGTGATFLANRDLNGDGRPDIVVVNTGANTISVLLATSGGSFAAPVNIGVGTSPADVAIGDLNGDGRPDLVVTNTGSNNISILFNVGGGAFTSAGTLPLPAGSAPEGVAIADLDGSGVGDIVVTNTGSNTVSVFLATGLGTFVSAGTFTTGNAPVSVAVADFNGDGKPDLATANADFGDNNVTVLLGNGNGTFQTATVINVNPSAASVCADPDALVATDLNGDSKVDIAIACTGGTVSVLLGNGNGTFATAVSFSTGSSSGPEAIAVADFDGKTGPDIVIADSGNNAVFLLNNGSAAFSTTLACNGAGNGAFGVTAGDFNGDGKPDIAVANSIDGTVSVLLNNGTIAPGSGTCIGGTPTPQANFTVTVAPTSVTTHAGTLVTYTVTVTPGPGFKEAVALGCASTAPASGCSLNPKRVFPNGAAVNSTLSVATNFNSSGGAIFGQVSPGQAPIPNAGKALYAMLSFGGAGVFGLVLSRRARSKGRRRLGVAITILGLVMIFIALAGCGGGKNFPAGSTITPPGTYTITVTGTAGVGTAVTSASGTTSLVVN